MSREPRKRRGGGRRRSPEKVSKDRLERGTEQNAVCVFRIKGSPIVDFPGRCLSDSPRHSRRHLRFSILAKASATAGHVLRALRDPLLPRLPPSSPPPSSSSSLISMVATLRLYLRGIKSFIVRRPQKKVMKLSRRIHERASPSGPVANAIRKSTRWCPRWIIARDRSGWSAIRSSTSSMTYLLATTVTDERAKREPAGFLTHRDCSLSRDCHVRDTREKRCSPIRRHRCVSLGFSPFLWDIQRNSIRLIISSKLSPKVRIDREGD